MPTFSLTDESLDQYHGDKSCIKSSMVRCFRRSPLLYHDTYIAGTVEQFQSDALTLGTLWHTVRELGWQGFLEAVTTLGPEHLTPSGAVSTKKETRAFLATCAEEGRVVVSTDQLKTLQAMEERFWKNVRANAIEKGVERRETSVRWECQRTGLILAVRPDALSGTDIVDYKTTSDQNPRLTFARSVEKYGYDIADAMYSDGCWAAGLGTSAMTFVVTSTVAPFETVVCRLSDSYRARAASEYRMLLDDLATRLKDDDWMPNGYGETVTIEERR